MNVLRKFLKATEESGKDNFFQEKRFFGILRKLIWIYEILILVKILTMTLMLTYILSTIWEKLIENDDSLGHQIYHKMDQTLPCGVVFHLIWVVALVLFISGIYFYPKPSKLKKDV